MIETIGSVAALLTTFSFLPQVIKTWRTRSAADLSWIWLVGFSAGLFLWMLYGIALGSIPLVGANFVTLSLVLMIAGIKWREGNSG
jgi:MtN3 and saliva related transmembrane protein